MLFVVECENGRVTLDFPGLTFERAIERCEAERGKAMWRSVRITREDDGRVVVAYHGGASYQGAVG